MCCSGRSDILKMSQNNFDVLMARNQSWTSNIKVNQALLYVGLFATIALTTISIGKIYLYVRNTNQKVNFIINSMNMDVSDADIVIGNAIHDDVVVFPVLSNSGSSCSINDDT